MACTEDSFKTSARGYQAIVVGYSALCILPLLHVNLNAFKHDDLSACYDRNELILKTLVKIFSGGFNDISTVSVYFKKSLVYFVPNIPVLL